jgi:lysophospholipase L1-like esterase
MIFAGDSITHSGEYINGLMELYPTSLMLNKGTNGYKIFDLEADWQSLCIDYEPNVVTILIGINEVIDAMRGMPNMEQRFEESYARVIEQTRANTNADIILMEPFIMAYPKKLFNWMLVTKRFVNVVDRLAAKYNTGLVKLWDVFNQADASLMTLDGIHITPEGHKLITAAWNEEYKRILSLKEEKED